MLLILVDFVCNTEHYPR